MGRSNDESFRLVQTELYTVLQIPLSDISGTLSKNGCVVGAHGEMKLRVVGVMMILYAVVSNDVGDPAAVDCKQQSPEYRPLLDTHIGHGSLWLVLADLDKLSPAFKIGLQTVEWCLYHSELEPQAIEEQPVVNGVEGCWQVKANQDSDLLVVGRCEGRVQDFQYCSLLGMSLPVCRLELAEVSTAEQMEPQACQHE